MVVCRCAVLRVRFQPYAMAVQTRFKWRHKETDRWRRLMDATCFPVDWISQTLGSNFSQYSGHWTHLLTCAHVICPWDYPNYYAPDGPTRFVSHITLADTMTVVKIVSLQGLGVHKHFTSNQHVYVHSNPRLDLCVVHPEQNFKRSGEMKMLWMQNEGYVMRPRLELLRPLQVGDHVWIYGMKAFESLLDEEKGPEPLMVPTGVRARVHTLTREHFFLDTTSVEAQLRGESEATDNTNIGMGMCGSVVMRDGKCVGMLTATVHQDSETRELAGTAMCTYAHDIFEFLLEVEKQMKSLPPTLQTDETRFEQKRREEEEEATARNAASGAATSSVWKERQARRDKDWELDHSRMARHIPVPSSLWRMDQMWMTEEDAMTSYVFGRSGFFNQETQENSLGYDMESARTHGERPGDIDAYSSTSASGKPEMQGSRRDDSPSDIYTTPEDFSKRKDEWDYSVGDDVRSLFDSAVETKDDVSTLSAMRRSLETIRAQRATAQMKETAMKHPRGRAPRDGDGDSRRFYEDFSGGTGHFDGDATAAATGGEEFNPDSSGNASTVSGGGGGTSSAARRRQRRQSGKEKGSMSEAEDEEAEAKYQRELRRRHGQKAGPFGDADLAGLWERH